MTYLLICYSIFSRPCFTSITRQFYQLKIIILNLLYVLTLILRR